MYRDHARTAGTVKIKHMATGVLAKITSLELTVKVSMLLLIMTH